MLLLFRFFGRLEAMLAEATGLVRMLHRKRRRGRISLAP